MRQLGLLSRWTKHQVSLEILTSVTLFGLRNKLRNRKWRCSSRLVMPRASPQYVNIRKMKKKKKDKKEKSKTKKDKKRRRKRRKSCKNKKLRKRCKPELKPDIDSESDSDSDDQMILYVASSSDSDSDIGDSISEIASQFEKKDEFEKIDGSESLRSYSYKRTCSPPKRGGTSEYINSVYDNCNSWFDQPVA